MNPLIHYIGTAATYGWLLHHPGSGEEGYEGLRFQVLVLMPEGPDLEIPAYLADGEVQVGDAPVAEALLMAIDLAPGDLPIEPGTYRALRRLDDGSGWQIIPASEFYLKLRRLDP